MFFCSLSLFLLFKLLLFHNQIYILSSCQYWQVQKICYFDIDCLYPQTCIGLLRLISFSLPRKSQMARSLKRKRRRKSNYHPIFRVAMLSKFHIEGLNQWCGSSHAQLEHIPINEIQKIVSELLGTSLRIPRSPRASRASLGPDALYALRDRGYLHRKGQSNQKSMVLHSTSTASFSTMIKSLQNLAGWGNSSR